MTTSPPDTMLPPTASRISTFVLRGLDHEHDYPRVLDKTINQNIERWSRSDAFMHATICKIVNGPG